MSFLMRPEMWMREILEGKRRGKSALWLLSKLYEAGVRLRHKAYHLNLLPTKKVDAIVVSVGNIVAGGVGKTPLVHFLAEALSKENQVAILSRGYRAEAENKSESFLVTPSMEASQVGDEPLLLAQKLPHVRVWVGSDRIQSAEKAIKDGAEILLLDDGMQHLRLERDFDVCVVSGDTPFSNGHFLPRGYLRDMPSRLHDASLVAVMGSKTLDFKVPQVVFKRSLSAQLKGRRVALFCAIANPERFINDVQTQGATITSSLIKSDHTPFFKEELEELAILSKAEVLVCTEKDFVKLSPMQISIPIVALPMELSITDGEEIWKEFIHQIKERVQHVRISSHAS